MLKKIKLVDKLVEECNETIDKEVEIIDNNKNKCNSHIVYIVLFKIFFTISFGIGAYFSYYKYVNRNKKMFLDMIMFIINHIKWEKSNKLTLKIEVTIFIMTLLISKILLQGCWKLPRNYLKT